MKNHIIIPALPYRIAQSVAKAKEIMDADISRHIPIRDLAKGAFTNEFTLKRFFKIVYSTTIYQHLLAERMRLANHLLIHTQLLEKDIARQCGFQKLSGFVSSYKKYHGITPGQFRMLSFHKGSS